MSDKPLVPRGLVCSSCGEMAQPHGQICRHCGADWDDAEIFDEWERANVRVWPSDPLCREDFTMCRCGLSFTGGPAYHRRHLAEPVARSPVVHGPHL